MSGMKSSPLPVWARLKAIKEITGAPENWLYAFAASNPKAVRKFGNGGTNGTLVFNVSKVCEAIEKIKITNGGVK